MIHFRYRPHYFEQHLNREVTEIYWHTILNSLALSLVFIFEPIYLYSIGYNLIHILWFYVEVYVFYILFITLGAKFASAFGYKHSIFVSNIFYVIYWAALFLIKSHPALFWIAPLFFALQKSWFWPADNAEISLSSIQVQRGREIGVLQALIQLAFIVGPFLGGFVSQELGFLTLFIFAAGLMLFSVYPLFTSPEVYSRHEFKFKNLWAVFQNHKSNFFGYWGYAEDLMVQSLWPVYIFMIIPNFFEVGAITTIATVIGTVLMLYIGRLADKTNKRRLIEFGAIAYGVTWFFRFLARGLAGVLTFDILTKTGKDITSVPMVSLTYEHAGSRGPDYAIAYSVFYEFSLSVGKLVTAFAALAILGSGGSIYWVFALTGGLTMFYKLLK